MSVKFSASQGWGQFHFNFGNKYQIPICFIFELIEIKLTKTSRVGSQLMNMLLGSVDVNLEQTLEAVQGGVWISAKLRCGPLPQIRHPSSSFHRQSSIVLHRHEMDVFHFCVRQCPNPPPQSKSELVYLILSVMLGCMHLSLTHTLTHSSIYWNIFSLSC